MKQVGEIKVAKSLIYRDNYANNYFVDKKLTPELFAQLLNALSFDKTEAGIAYTKLRDSLVRFFQLKGDSEPEKAADETLDRVALKLSQNAEIDDLTKYSFGVARFIFLERIRIVQKEKDTNQEFYSNKISIGAEKDETDDFLPYRECFQALPNEDKKMLGEYFVDLPHDKLNDYRQKLSSELDISISNLRLKIYRLRKQLADCLNRKRKNN